MSLVERGIIKNIARFSPLEYTITTNLDDSRRFPSLRDDNKLHFCMEGPHITELELLVEDRPISDQHSKALLRVQDLRCLKEIAIYTYSSLGSEVSKIFLKNLYDFENLNHELFNQ